MYRTSFVLLAVVCLSGCKTTQLYPLATSYQSDPVINQAISKTSREDAWNRVIRFFADYNLPIKTIDKNSGFIESDVLSFTGSYRIDGDTMDIGSPVYVIVQREIAYGKIIQPSYITGHLKIFMLPDSSGTGVRVQIEDLKSFHIVDIHHKHSSVVTHDEIPRQAISTSLLEKQMCDFIVYGVDTNHIALQKGEILNPKNNYSAYLKKWNKIFMGSLLGGELGGIAIIVSTLSILKKH
jgi:hypothetical protein